MSTFEQNVGSNEIFRVSVDRWSIQGGPTKVKPTYITIWRDHGFYTMLSKEVVAFNTKKKRRETCCR